MKLKDQVCTRDQAKRLKELGIMGESYFLHGTNEQIVEMWVIEGTEDDFAATFTVAELGVMLPEWIDQEGVKYRFEQWHNVPGQSKSKYVNDLLQAEEWRLAYRENPVDCLDEVGDNIKGPTEAQARGAMLIYLLQKGLVSAEDVNKRLAK